MKAGVGVAEEHHVVSEQVVLGGREGRQGRAVLLAVFRVGREEDDVQVDRLVAFEIVLQVAELVARFAVDVEDLELLLADRDHALRCDCCRSEARAGWSTSRINVRSPVVLGR